MDRAKIEAYRASLRTIEARAEAVRAGKIPETYTEKLLASQNERVKKLSSEAGELVREDWRPDFDESRFVGEAADVYYGLEVMAAARGLDFVLVGRERTRLYDEFATDEQLLGRMLGDKPGRLQSFGAATMAVVANECRPDFEAGRFVNATATALLMTDFILAGQCLTAEPVIDELIRRNREGQGR